MLKFSPIRNTTVFHKEPDTPSKSAFQTINKAVTKTVAVSVPVRYHTFFRIEQQAERQTLLL